jgi:hypothetical protein
MVTLFPQKIILTVLRKLRLSLSYQCTLCLLTASVSTGEAALHESCSYFNTSQFQSQRAEFQEFVRTKIIERYDNLYADITDLQVKTGKLYSCD